LGCSKHPFDAESKIKSRQLGLLSKILFHLDAHQPIQRELRLDHLLSGGLVFRSSLRSFMKTAILSLFALSALAHAQEPAIDFEKQIFPILEAKCVKCHAKEKEEGGKVKRPKGKLRLDSAAAILAGGKDYAEQAVIPGKPDESWLLKTMLLPPSDEMAMPPEDKGERVTAEEAELVKKWIASGANFGGWKGVE
jgi:uncharacterized membrane protein